MRDEVQNAIAVSPLVIVPSDKLEKVLVQGDTGFGVEDARVRIALHVVRDDFLVRISEYA